MFLKLKQELEPLLFRNNYYVDVRDMSGSWIVGKIIEVNNEELILKIRMEGTKQEIVYKFSSFSLRIQKNLNLVFSCFFSRKEIQVQFRKNRTFPIIHQKSEKKSGFLN